MRVRSTGDPITVDAADRRALRALVRAEPGAVSRPLRLQQADVRPAAAFAPPASSRTRWGLALAATAGGLAALWLIGKLRG